jgi:hypothetical protein
MKKIYQNDLEELECLMNRISFEIEKYSHVSEHLPKKLLNELEKFSDKVNDELNRREEELFNED